MRRKEAGLHHWNALWFLYGSREYGEYFPIYFGEYNLKSGKINWHVLSHARYDGISGYMALTEGRAVFLGRKPTGVAMKYGLRQFISFLLFSNKKRNVSWRLMTDASPHVEDVPPVFHIFTPHETKAITASCKKQGVSLSAFFLAPLIEILTPEVCYSTDAEEIWMIPVNARSRAEEISLRGNRSAYIAIKTGYGESAQVIDDKIKGALKRGMQHGAVKTLMLGKYTGGRTLKRIVRHIKRKNIKWFGSFSNLGSWEDLQEPEVARFGVPPVTPNQPVGAGVITWNGRMIVTLRLHSIIRRPGNFTHDLLRKWVDRL